MKPTAPRATYRLQLSKDFDFDAATACADYLAALGVSHVYCSPVLQATPGSAHGYDVVDPTQINAGLGGEAGFRRFATAMQDRKSTRLNSSHRCISYAVFCLKKKKKNKQKT